MTKEEKAQRGREATQLLENKLLNEAFNKTEETLLSMWRKSDAADTEGRERIYMSLRMFDNVKHHIEVVARTGDVAQKELTQTRRQRNG